MASSEIARRIHGPGRMHLCPIVDSGIFARVWEVVRRFNAPQPVHPDIHIMYKKAAVACVQVRSPKYLLALFEQQPTPYYKAHGQHLEAELRAALGLLNFRAPPTADAAPQ